MGKENPSSVSPVKSTWWVKSAVITVVVYCTTNCAIFATVAAEKWCRKSVKISNSSPFPGQKETTMAQAAVAVLVLAVTYHASDSASINISNGKAILIVLYRQLWWNEIRKYWSGA